MEENLEVSLDNLPIKRVAAMEENGFERFQIDKDYDQKRTEMITSIDFAWAVEKDAKKRKVSKEAAKPWLFESLWSNLQLAQQEVLYITDLISTVEANDAVTVAGMTRPKQLPHEVLVDVSVTVATKLQCFWGLGKYFKQSAKALEQQVAKETRFYGALIRLQHNWKIKRQRLAVSAPGSEGFSIDLFDNTLSDPTISRPPSISAVLIDRDSAGMLAVQMPPKSSQSISFGFVGAPSVSKSRRQTKQGTSDQPITENKKDFLREEEVNKRIKEVHSALREVHRVIFEEQVFDLVNREAFKSSPGFNVTGIRENYLQLGIGQDASIYLSLVSPDQDADPTVDSTHNLNLVDADLPLDTLEGVMVAEEAASSLENSTGYPSSLSCEIYLQQISHDNVFVRPKSKDSSTSKNQLSAKFTGHGCELLGHFCKTLAHRIFSKKVLNQLENLANNVPYLHLVSHPTWHSRTSSWSLSVEVPQAILQTGCRTRPSDIHSSKRRVTSHFLMKIVVFDDCINIEGEGAPNVSGLFKENSDDVCSMNNYDSNLADLPLILLQQVASQVVHWLHEEALVVGMKASRDFLNLSFELEQGGRLCLVAHVDPNDSNGCISWWLVMADGLMKDGKFTTDFSKGEPENVRFLGHLSLQTLYSTLMDLVCACNSSGIF